MILASLSENDIPGMGSSDDVEEIDNANENGENESGGESDESEGSPDDGSNSDSPSPSVGGGSGGNDQAVTSGGSPDTETDSGGSESETSDKLDEVLEKLEIVKQGGGEDQAFSDFAESLDGLVRLLSAKVEESEIIISVYPVLPEKYQDFSYPITVQFEVLESGSSYSMYTNFCCSSPSLLADQIASYTSEIDSGKLNLVCTQYVWDKDDALVYDYEHAVIEEENDEPSETELTEIELLESINTELQAIRENEIAHYEEIKQMLSEQIGVSGYLYGSIVAVGFAVFLGVGFAIANNFWSRMKVG